MFNQQAKKKKQEENGFMKSLGMYVLMSLFLIPIVVFGKNYFFQMSIFYGIVMFLVMTSMISDFSNVLLDVRDKGILLTKPVGKK
ncbi:2TM domain-containing protein, partial [Alkalihalophilus pseudofirmus]